MRAQAERLSWPTCAGIQWVANGILEQENQGKIYLVAARGSKKSVVADQAASDDIS